MQIKNAEIKREKNMGNLDIYNLVREVPKEAKKEISAGRLKGMTDINPMWRIKKLTETFGPVGFGWWYEIKDMHTLRTDNSKEEMAVVTIKMYVKYNGEVSQPIEGTGGSLFVASESKGMHLSDECYKMALTDAISVCAKALGVGADVYWNKDKTKYSKSEEDESKNASNSSNEGNYSLSEQDRIKLDFIKAELEKRGTTEQALKWVSEKAIRDIKTVEELQPAEIEVLFRKLKN